MKTRRRLRRASLQALRMRLTFIFTALTGAVLMGMLTITLFLARTQAVTAAETLLVSNANTLITKLQSENSLSDVSLAQLEYVNSIVLFLSDNGNPLFFSGVWQPLTPRNILSQRAAETALQAGVDVNNAPRSSLHASQAPFSLMGDARETYFGVAASIPAAHGWYSMIMLQDMRALNAQLTQQAILYAGLFLLGLGVLAGVSWFLAGRTIAPTAAALQRQQDFVAAAGHELRSPLAVLKTSLAALQAEPAQGAQYLKTIDSETNRMARLVDDLLLLAGSDAGQWKIQFTALDTDTLMIETQEQLAPLVKACGMHLHLILPDDMLPPVYGDADRLRQIFLILVNNALAYAPAGSQIELRAALVKNGVALSVADHGPGIADAEKHKVFERFYRADQSRTDKNHYGLGLSVAQELAALHNGILTLCDTPGGGATFTLTLPT